MLSCNTLNPVCHVATVCHQVCCMYWGHLGLFHKAISPLKLYKMVCMGGLTCMFILIKFMSMFYMCSKSGIHRLFHWIFIAVLAKIHRNMSICDIFMQVATRKKYPVFILYLVDCNMDYTSLKLSNINTFWYWYSKYIFITNADNPNWIISH